MHIIKYAPEKKKENKYAPDYFGCEFYLIAPLNSSHINSSESVAH